MSETNNKGVKVLASASLLFVTIIWGSAFVVMKNSMDAITPTYLLAYRFTIAALGMAVSSSVGFPPEATPGQPPAES